MPKSTLYNKDADTGISIYYKVANIGIRKLYSFSCYISITELQKKDITIDGALRPFGEAYENAKNSGIGFTKPRYYTTPSQKYYKVIFNAYVDEDFAFFARLIEGIFQYFRDRGYNDRGSAFGRSFKRKKRSFYASIYENFELPCNDNVIFLVENKDGKARLALSFVEGGKRIPLDKFKELRKILTNPEMAGFDDGVFIHKFYYVPSDQVYFLEPDKYYQQTELYPKYREFAEKICGILNNFYGTEPEPVSEPVGEPSAEPNTAEGLTELIESLEISLKYLPKEQQDEVNEQIEAYKIALKYL